MEHKPVLLKEIIKYLDVKENDVVFDGTVGQGGHAKALADSLGYKGKFIGFDLDQSMLEKTYKELTGKVKPELFLAERNFKNITDVLKTWKIEKVDKIILDLGLNSVLLEESGRGFSFQKDEQLLMTYSKNIQNYIFTAEQIVNEWNEENLYEIIKNYGEESNAKKIASSIVTEREKKHIRSSRELADIIIDSVGGRRKINPATKTFQALRIAVNDELGALKIFLDQIPNLINKKGVLGIISFHSLEDRIVKLKFREWKEEGLGEIITKKPIPPTDEEIKDNPRSRSAKLRIFKFI